MLSWDGLFHQVPWIRISLVAVSAYCAYGAWTVTSPWVLAQRGRDESGAKYGWHANYQEAKALAKKSGLPLMVVIRCIP